MFEWQFFLMLVFSSVWLVWFLYHPVKSSVLDSKNSNIALARQKVAELEQDLSQGLMSDESFDQAKDEIAQTLALELEHTSRQNQENQKSTGILVFSVLFMFVLPISTYEWLKPSFDIDDTSIAQQQKQPLTIEQSVDKVRQHLNENPEDPEAWRMLGLSLFELGQVEDSVDAYKKAYEIDPNDVALLVQYASAVATLQDNQFFGLPAELVKQALKINPDAPDALYLAGMIAIDGGELELAKIAWEHALSLFDPTHPDRIVLENALAELAIIQSELTSPQYRVNVSVEISDELRKSRSDEDFVMIYAKSAVGRPMPIAIEKIKLKDFTGSVTLSNANSIMPTQRLSDAQQVIVVARISASGSAMKKAGDQEVVSSVVNVTENPNVYLRVE